MGGAAGRRGILKKHRERHAVSEHRDETNDAPALPPIEDIEEWSTYLSEELVDTYHTLVDYCASIGADFFTSNHGFFPDFVEWAFRVSSRQPRK